MNGGVDARFGNRDAGLARSPWSAAPARTPTTHHSHHSAPIKYCYTPNGTAYKPGDYCYTSCAPTAACQVQMCFADGQWMEVFPCKQRDCRKVCL